MAEHRKDALADTTAGDGSPQARLHLVDLEAWIARSGLTAEEAAAEIARRAAAGDPLPWEDERDQP